ncbi:glycosyltransferase [Azospirillum sp. ST 5-10]|uniref:glycosyltransferase n=1 Tax=unclassified Azospirillum TaxID=2630922 RepID=UPI003F49FA72
MIPKIIHHLWKNEAVPDRLALYRDTWRRLHPGWEHRLWTDAELRAFVAREFPDFLPVYDGYAEPIRRADAARYLILKRMGGLYVDLDFEALKPIDSLLDGPSLAIGLEPDSHLALDKAVRAGMTRILCPSLIASVPGHGFWDHVVGALRRNAGADDVLDATGPFLLTRAYDSYAAPETITLLPAHAVYPVDKMACWQGRLFDIRHWERVTRDAYALHHWDATWFRGVDAADRPPVPVRIVVSDGEAGAAGAPAPANDGERPLVSCLMTTRDRPAQALIAVDGFRRQTYPNRELVIVDDGAGTTLAQAVAALADPRIRLVRPEDAAPNLGRARNRAVALAAGPYVCQWDDDDLYDPFRIEVQMAALRGAGARACVLSQWLMWWPEAERLAVSRRRAWEGSLLCEKAVLPPYPELARGEDTPVVERLLRTVRVVHLDEPRLYLYVAHGRNTFPSSHFDEQWHAAEERWEGRRFQDVAVELGKRLPLAAYRQSLADAATLEERLAAARALLDTGRLDEATRAYAALRDAHPARPAVLEGAAQVAAAARRWRDAAALWDRLLAQAPEHASGRLGRGVARLELGRFAEAEADLTALARQLPEEPAVRVALAELAVRQRNWTVARARWRRVLCLDPASSRGWGGLVIALVEIGRLDAAETVARSRGPALGRADAVVMLAAVLHRRQRDAELAALLDANRDVVAGQPALRALHFHTLLVRGDLEAACTVAFPGGGAGTVQHDLMTAAYTRGPEGRRALHALWRKHGTDVLSPDLVGPAAQAVREAEGESGLRAFFDAVDDLPPHDERSIRLRLMAVFERLRFGLGDGTAAQALRRLADRRDPHAPLGHWGEALRRFADGFDRLRTRFPAFHVESGWTRADAEAVTGRILDAHRHRRPFSLIRLGDGEGNFLPYPPGQEEHADADRAATQFIWWGGALLEGDAAAAMSAALGTAVRNADVVGVPDLARLCYGLPLPTPPFLFHSWHDYRGLLVVLHHLAQQGQDALFRPAQTVASCHVHADLAAWGQYERLFAEIRRVSLITCHPGLAAALSERFGVAVDQDVRIPHEAKYAAQFGYPEAGPHYPDAFRTLERTLAVREPGEVFLVAAGFLGKLYCDWIKARGGIALDVGSVADQWLGFNTRSLHFAQRYEAPPPAPELPASAPAAAGVSVFGHFGAGVGLGVAACGLLDALAAAGIPHTAVDLDSPAIGAAPRHPVTIVHTNPDLLLASGRDRRLQEALRGRIRIGVWAWESATSFPAAWQPAFALFDEIWAPSRFAAEALRRVSPIPVAVVPHVVAPAPSAATRRDLGLPDDAFVFAFLFDELSDFERKNPLGVVAAFRRAFPVADGRTLLLIKARTLSPAGRARLEAAIDGHPSILLRVGDAPRAEALAIIAQCDAYVSLHRAEGFGLTVAEAMAFGKPVIATAGSGVEDFLSDDCAFPVPGRAVTLDAPVGYYPAGTVWTEPDLDEAAQLMRAVCYGRGLARARARRAAERVRDRLSADAVGARVAERLAAVRRHPSVLVLIPVRNARRHLPALLTLLERLDHPRDRLSLALLEGDSEDGSAAFLEAELPRLAGRFRRVELHRHDTGVRFDGPRWAPAVQRLRRGAIARARNRLLQAALRDEEWVLWVDADVADAPADALRRLLDSGHDIVVPHCVLQPGGPTFDLNTFQLTDGAAGEAQHMVDGLVQPPRGVGRRYLDALRGRGPVPVDGVGGTMLLVRADLHRDGLVFPAAPYRGYIETEGLAMMARDMGVTCWGLPDLEIRHAPE